LSRPGSRSDKRGPKSARGTTEAANHGSGNGEHLGDSHKKGDKPHRDGKKKNTLNAKSAAHATRVSFELEDEPDDKKESQKDVPDDKQESQKDVPDNKPESQKDVLDNKQDIGIEPEIP